MLWEWGRLGRLKPPAIAVAGGSLFVLLELFCGASILLGGGYVFGKQICFGELVGFGKCGLFWEWGCVG